MANLDDLGYESLTEMSVDEALERIRQIRLSRRTPLSPRKKSTKKKQTTKMSSISPEMAAEMLKVLGGK